MCSESGVSGIIKQFSTQNAPFPGHNIWYPPTQKPEAAILVSPFFPGYCRFSTHWVEKLYPVGIHLIELAGISKVGVQSRAPPDTPALLITRIHVPLHQQIKPVFLFFGFPRKHHNQARYEISFFAGGGRGCFSL